MNFFSGENCKVQVAKCEIVLLQGLFVSSVPACAPAAVALLASLGNGQHFSCYELQHGLYNQLGADPVYDVSIMRLWGDFLFFPHKNCIDRDIMRS